MDSGTKTGFQCKSRTAQTCIPTAQVRKWPSPWLDIPAEVLPVGCSVTSNSAGSWTIAHQALLSISRQEYWSRLPFPPPGGIKPAALASPALAGGFFTTSVTWEALPRRALNVILRSLELYSGATCKPLTGFQGRGIRSEKDTIDTRNICLLSIFVTRNKTFSLCKTQTLLNT